MCITQLASPTQGVFCNTHCSFQTPESVVTGANEQEQWGRKQQHCLPIWSSKGHSIDITNLPQDLWHFGYFASTIAENNISGSFPWRVIGEHQHQYQNYKAIKPITLLQRQCLPSRHHTWLTGGKDEMITRAALISLVKDTPLSFLIKHWNGASREPQP